MGGGGIDLLGIILRLQQRGHTSCLAGRGSKRNSWHVILLMAEDRKGAAVADIWPAGGANVSSKVTPSSRFKMEKYYCAEARQPAGGVEARKEVKRSFGKKAFNRTVNVLEQSGCQMKQRPLKRFTVGLGGRQR